MSATGRYAFDNDDPTSVDRHSILAEALDELSISRLSAINGHSDPDSLIGFRCLEIGAGGGSVAAWLGVRTGPSGRVLATDINTRHLRPNAGYEILQHDLTTEPIPEGPWDVIHARLVLLHLPARREILRRLVEALAPGGALLIEDFESTFGKTVLVGPTAEDVALVDLYHRLLVDEVMPGRGNDPGWASQVPAAMLDAGLTDVDTVVFARSWTGGGAGALLIAANITQLRADFLAAGMTGDQLDALQRLTADPRLVVRTPLTYSTSGRRPER